MKNLLATTIACGITLLACSTTTPPPPPPVAEAQPAAAGKTPPAPAKKPAAETAAKPATTATPPPAAASKSTAAKPPPKAAPPKTEAAAAPKTESVAKAPVPAPAAQPAKSAPLDLRSLEQRLKDSNAIGVMTKLSLKNQVDDLVSRFRAYHNGERPPTLPQLRPAFDLLLMKVLSLLQDKDPALAHEIDASREAIWGVLSDRARFAQFT